MFPYTKRHAQLQFIVRYMVSSCRAGAAHLPLCNTYHACGACNKSKLLAYTNTDTCVHICVSLLPPNTLSVIISFAVVVFVVTLVALSIITRVSMRIAPRGVACLAQRMVVKINPSRFATNSSLLPPPREEALISVLLNHNDQRTSTKKKKNEVIAVNC